MAEPALAVRSLSKSFGALLVTDDVSLELEQGELHALIGPNGAGKTTLVHQISGLLAPDRGQVLLEGADITHRPMHERVRMGLVRSFQITTILPRLTTLENVALAAQSHAGSSFRFLRRVSGEADINAAAESALGSVGLEARADVPAGLLSHGERRQLELAIAIALRPRVLLLDEPMAGTGHEDSGELIARLAALKGSATILLIEHDMEAVFSLADRISVLVYGRIIATGTPGEIRENQQVRTAYLGEDDIAAGEVRPA